MMSYTVSQPPAKPRPAVVTYAVYLMWFVVAAQVINFLVGLIPNEQLDQALADFEAANPELTEPAGFEATSAVFTVLITIIITVGLAVLAVFVGRGSQPARVTTWVIGGIAVLCVGCGLILTAAGPALLASAGDTPEVQLQRDYLEVIQQNTPGWMTAITVGLTILALLALIAVIIMLAMPAANDFFRKEQQTWVPPSDLSGGGWPGNPTPPHNPTQ
jgi:hypothetical protein